MRAFYILGIIFSILLIIVTGYFIAEYQSARYSYYSYDYSYNSYGSDSSYYEMREVTSNWAITTLFFFLYYIAVDILGLVKIKRTTTKVLSIIGLSLSGIMLFWDLLVISSPGGISVDEVGGVWVLYALIYLAFSIVGLVQAVKWKNRNKLNSNDKVLDDLLNEGV